MMKEFDEKRSVDVKVARTVCDICGDATKDGDAVIHIQARREEARDPRYAGLTGYSAGNPGLDICSVDCLARNINGITLVLNTKVIPSIETNKTINLSNGTNNIFTSSGTYSAGTTLTATAANQAQWATPTIGVSVVNV